MHIWSQNNRIQVSSQHTQTPYSKNLVYNAELEPYTIHIYITIPLTYDTYDMPYCIIYDKFDCNYVCLFGFEECVSFLIWKIMFWCVLFDSLDGGRWAVKKTTIKFDFYVVWWQWDIIIIWSIKPCMCFVFHCFFYILFLLCIV